MLLPDAPEGALWAIFLLPVASLTLNAAGLRHWPRWCGYVTVATLGAAFLLSLWVLDTSLESDGLDLAFDTHEWLAFANLRVNVGLTVDGLTAVMLLVVTGVSLVVQFYSQGYMAGDEGYARYFAFMSLFTASMLGLVLADNLVLLYVFWEMVGLCSYLLIGFWYQRPAAAAAAKKAFLVTRLGDLGFLAAIVLMWRETGTFDIGELQGLAAAGAIGGTALTLFALGVFSGAAGKSAQFPLHVWLPDAMEGPTPVSALIHAATMVAAGVYLVARLFPVFAVAGEVLTVVGAIGGTTALIAAGMGLVNHDIKRVLAYSTISQLGYMMLALGVGAYGAAVFHLFNHAFFKALLFLASGSVSHATGTFDLRAMGGLRRPMPWTTATFAVGALSLAGLFPFAGYWSKDEIFGAAWDGRPALFWVAIATEFLTAAYIARVFFLTFGGEYRGARAGVEAAAAHGAHGHGLHESPAVMVLPMAMLAVLAFLSGLVNVNEGFSHLLRGALPPGTEEHEFRFRFGIAALANGLGLAGLGAAWAVYSARLVSAEAVGRAFRPLYVLLRERYYLDWLYETVLVRWLLYRGVGRALALFDGRVVDGAVSGAGLGARWLGGQLRYLQAGQLQAYGAAAFTGLVIIIVIFLGLNP